MREFAKFLEDYPAYSATSVLDDLRRAEFARLTTSVKSISTTLDQAFTLIRKFVSTPNLWLGMFWAIRTQRSEPN